MKPRMNDNTNFGSKVSVFIQKNVAVSSSFTIYCYGDQMDGEKDGIIRFHFQHLNLVIDHSKEFFVQQCLAIPTYTYRL